MSIAVSHSVDPVPQPTASCQSPVKPVAACPVCIPANNSAPPPKTVPPRGQYDDPVAGFFDIFNRRTGRDTLFWGYMQGHFANNPALMHQGSLAVDFGCGTGWLTSHLARNFSRVYGIDTSESMLKIALENTRGKSEQISFFQEPPQNIVSKCDFIAAVHVHYHFDTVKKLREEFFQAAADLLKPGGELLLVGCPSGHIRNSPPHYKNLVNVADIPDDTLSSASQVSLLADDQGYIALEDVPQFALKDGTQMKVDFRTTDDKGRPRAISLTDTYWSDESLIETAKAVGLFLEKRTNLTWRDCPNAYMAMHFRKLVSPQP